MKMNFLSAKFVSATMAAIVSLSCAVPSAFAATPAQTNPTTIASHPDNTMSPTETVYPIGTKSFYKVTGTTVSYADQNTEGYSAVPSSYIKGSEYNTTGKDYGMYVTKDGKVHYVELSLCHLEDGVYTWYHGTSDSATVSSDVDTATNDDNSMGTDFYLNIEKDAIDPEGTTSEENILKGTNDPRVDYELTVSTKATYQLDVTVPAYVCMYGYGGDGNIVEPTAEAYRLKNYSTSNSDTSATIKDITKITHFTKIYDEEHSNERVYSIAYNTTTGSYQYWYSVPSSEPGAGWVYYVIPDSYGINASGECYVIYIDGSWHFQMAGVLEGDSLKESVTAVTSDHALSENFLYGPADQWNFGKTPAVGDTKEGGKNVGMSVMVSGIQAQPHTWKMVGVSTPVSDMKRGELAMSIAPEKASFNAGAIDLSTASAKLDITERGWILDAPTMNADGTVKEATSLGMNVKAQMAGGAVNDAGCTSVVTVNYTVIPQFSGRSVETGTASASGVPSNYNM